MRAGSGGAIPANRQGVRGFTLVWAMAALAVLSIGLAAVGSNWADQSRRDQEQDLIRIGAAYARAIASYHQSSPGSVKRYPPTLQALLDDQRTVGLRRHLRELYPDPITRAANWGLVRAPDGGVLGVYSVSSAAPLRQTSQDLGVAVLAAAHRYDEWKFIPKANP